MNGMDNNILLTIIIPTYNRAEELDECLSCIAPQVYDNIDLVHIYISDNDSKDNTREVVDSYNSKYPGCISYFKQKENITASPNFDHAVHSVVTPYIYMLSDDDIVVPNFVTYILSIINKYPDVKYFYLNRYRSEMDYTNCELVYNKLGKEDVVQYSNGGDLLKVHLAGPSCISTNLFRKDVWANYSDQCLKSCAGFQWFSILSQGCLKEKSAFIQHPMFICRVPRVQRYSDNWVYYYTYGLGSLFKYLDRQANGLYETWIKQQQLVNKRVFLALLCSVANNKKLYQERRNDMKSHLHSPMVRSLYDLIVYVSPRWFSMYIIRNIIRSLKLFELFKRN